MDIYEVPVQYVSRIVKAGGFSVVIALKHVPKEIRKHFSKLVPKIKFMGATFMDIYASPLVSRKLVFYKSAGKFSTKVLFMTINIETT